MKLFKGQEDKILQKAINFGNVNIIDITKLSDLPGSAIRIDKVLLRFSINEDKKGIQKYVVTKYCDSEVNATYFSTYFNQSAANKLISDFKKNADKTLGLYKIFQYEDDNGIDKEALCRKFIEMSYDLNAEEKEDFYQEHKEYMNILYHNEYYSIIKIIEKDEGFITREKLSDTHINSESNNIIENSEENEGQQDSKEENEIKSIELL